MTTLSCEINKVPIIVILDSGANCNIIAEEIVNELDLKINDISDVEIYTPIGKLDTVGVIHKISISILSQGPKWKQVKVTDIFVVSIPEYVLMLGNSWFKDNAMKVDFPNKTLTLLDGTKTLVEGKISVKVLIDTLLKFNTISKSLELQSRPINDSSNHGLEGPRDRLSEYGVNYIINNIKTSEAWLQFAKYYSPKYVRKRLLKLGYEINSRDYWENFVFCIKNNLTIHKQIGNDPKYRDFKVQLALYKKNCALLII
ncbi:45985_t:CDS:2 [Gigaspora margarita]|uniref:45985_t:CDS:1 n=1 Tax=Gigaspora margarita TaxID=4874 RepID=A0ABN7VZ50_GIGMA|nr:45985_t:CDS:2 [Gigaspora margarita]